MMRVVTGALCALLLNFLSFPPASLAQDKGATISDFKVQPLYRAAKLSWTVKKELKADLTVQILRAETTEDSPYKEIASVKLTPGKTGYDYIDKSMGAEAKYFYKLVIKETNESFGPGPTRPFFSPPAT